jgi:hypothetical protein
MYKLVGIVSAMVVLAGCAGETSPPADERDEQDQQVRVDQQAEQAPAPEPTRVAPPTTKSTVKPAALYTGTWD